MAHDRQYKDDSMDKYRVVAFDYVKKGDKYWDRERLRVVTAETHMTGLRALILEEK